MVLFHVGFDALLLSPEFQKEPLATLISDNLGGEGFDLKFSHEDQHTRTYKNMAVSVGIQTALFCLQICFYPVYSGVPSIHLKSSL